MTEDDINILNNYKNGKIYTIRCRTDNNLFYVGSSIQPLHKRWHEHKSKTKSENIKYSKILLYSKMREIGTDNFYIELYESCSCETKEQLNQREGQIIREIQPTLNKYIAGRTFQEYKEECVDKIKEHKKEYIELNKDKIKAHKKEYYENNKEKVNKKNKEYYEKNKEKQLAKQKQQYEERKAIKDQQKQINELKNILIKKI